MAEWSREEIKSLIIKTIREYLAGYLSGSEATRKETTLSTLDFDERSARARKRSNFRRPLPIADWRDRYEAWRPRPHPPKGHEDLLADADIAMFNLRGAGYSGAGDAVSALLLCAPARADCLVVEGRVVVEGGELRTLPLDATLRRHRKAAALMRGAAK